MPSPNSVDQCKGLKLNDADLKALQEGCQIYGYIEVNRVSDLVRRSRWALVVRLKGVLSLTEPNFRGVLSLFIQKVMATNYASIYQLIDIPTSPSSPSPPSHLVREISNLAASPRSCWMAPPYRASLLPRETKMCEFPTDYSPHHRLYFAEAAVQPRVSVTFDLRPCGPQVGGNFHISPGRSYQHGHIHGMSSVVRVEHFCRLSFEITHYQLHEPRSKGK